MGTLLDKLGKCAAISAAMGIATAAVAGGAGVAVGGPLGFLLGLAGGFGVFIVSSIVCVFLAEGTGGTRRGPGLASVRLEAPPSAPRDADVQLKLHVTVSDPDHIGFELTEVVTAQHQPTAKKVIQLSGNSMQVYTHTVKWPDTGEMIIGGAALLISQFGANGKDASGPSLIRITP